ncbi:MAG: hypothetical protein Q8P90_01280 [bacterium]|nr:hypothetical protein [bacterium]
MDWLNKYKKDITAGSTLVETLVALAIFALIFSSLMSLLISGSRLVRANEARLTATAVANKKMEIIKNLSYNDVGTENGVPAGSILQSEVELLNGINFTITTDIRYVDDTYDDVAPIDTINTDYKQVRIDVTWSDPAGGMPVTLATNIVPNAIETDLNGGTLNVSVFDPYTNPIEPVPNATINVEAPDVIPAVSVTSQTDSNGNFILPGATEGIEAYEVTITKPGYGNDRTYDVDPINNPNPSTSHLNIMDGEVTSEYFQISQLVNSLTIHMEDADTADPISASFSMRGKKTIGTDGEGLPIYKYNEFHTTDEDGNYEATSIEVDPYQIIFDEAGEGYVITGYDQLLPFFAQADSYNTINFYLKTYEPFTSLFTVIDSSANVLAGNTVRLYTDDFSYDETIVATEYGQTFFDGLQPVTYNLHVSLVGYTPYNDTIIINGNENQTISLAIQ